MIRSSARSGWRSCNDGRKGGMPPDYEFDGGLLFDVKGTVANVLCPLAPRCSPPAPCIGSTLGEPLLALRTCR